MVTACIPIPGVLWVQVINAVPLCRIELFDEDPRLQIRQLISKQALLGTVSGLYCDRRPTRAARAYIFQDVRRCRGCCDDDQAVPTVRTFPAATHRDNKSLMMYMDLECIRMQDDRSRMHDASQTEGKGGISGYKRRRSVIASIACIPQDTLLCHLVPLKRCSWTKSNCYSQPSSYHPSHTRSYGKLT